MVADEASAKTGMCALNSRSQESHSQGLETNHSAVPGKVLQIDAKAEFEANGGHTKS